MGFEGKAKGRRAVFWFSALTGFWLLVNLLAMPLAWGGVSASTGFLAVVQGFILIGFVLVLFFDLVSLGWLTVQKGKHGDGVKKAWTFVHGVLALVAMMGAKVMVDEIARETPLGRAGGEWGILYALLVFQLFYLIVVLFRTKPVAH